jgi:hypothetical protein
MLRQEAQVGVRFHLIEHWKDAKKRRFLVVHIVIIFVLRCSILLGLVECCLISLHAFISLHASILVVRMVCQLPKKTLPRWVIEEQSTFWGPWDHGRLWVQFRWCAGEIPEAPLPLSFLTWGCQQLSQDFVTWLASKWPTTVLQLMMWRKIRGQSLMTWRNRVIMWENLWPMSRTRCRKRCLVIMWQEQRYKR